FPNAEVQFIRNLLRTCLDSRISHSRAIITRWASGKISIDNYVVTRYSYLRHMHNTPAPLTPAMFHVLLALADSDKHGYAMLKEVSEHTNGEVQLSTGTLYGIIKRLLLEGLIVEVRNRPSMESEDQRRRYYHLTPRGREVA